MTTPDKAILDRCQAALDQLTRDWESLVNIDSPTCHGAGLDRVGRFVADQLAGLGATVERIPVADPACGACVVGSLTGSGKGSVLLLAHMDTVFPVGEAARRPFRIDDEGYVRGPGVSDDKSGVILGLYVMRLLRESGVADFGRVTLLANCEEENGSHSARECIARLAREHDCSLCLEAGTPDDGICVTRAGSGNLVTEVTGVAAHAAYPWQGANAADELARRILALNALADRDKGTVVTTRVVESGLESRDKCVVPDRAAAVQRVYAFLPEELVRVESAALAMAAEPGLSGTAAATRFELAFPPLVETPGSRRLVALAQGIYAELGRQLPTTKAAAAADAGWASSTGCPTLCCMGPVTNGRNHTEHEGARFDTVVPRLYLVTRLVMEVGRNGLSA